MEETEKMPESIRPTFPGEHGLDVVWRDESDPALAGIRVLRTEDEVAVLVHRGELWDVVVVQGGKRAELGVLKADEVADALNAIVAA
jgi:hypothetical protein